MEQIDFLHSASSRGYRPTPLRNLGNAVAIGWISLLAVLAAPIHPAMANPKRQAPRFGFQHFPGVYIGGYSIATSTGTQAGPAKIHIRASANGHSGKVDWANTFYTSHGSYQIVLHWTFRSDGVVIASSIDPNSASLPAKGSVLLVGNHPVKFTAQDSTGTIAVTGQLRLIGGGTLSATATLTGLPDGDVTYGFSGSRKR